MMRLRNRRVGQRPDLRPFFRGPILAGLLLLVGVYLGSAWAVRRYTRPGHMSVVEAQAMDMSVMKPPVGAVPVAAMAAKREPLESTVEYTGTAVSFQDQDVTPRVTGTITWMPLYPGNRVRRGQIVARLDTAELGSKANEQAAAVSMAEHAVAIARMQSQQALGAKAQAQAQVQEARNEVASARSESAAAQQDVAAAQDERAGTQADLEGAQTGVTDAQAQLAAAQADQQYWSAQIKRSQALVKSGAISVQEFQQDQAQAENANAKVRQAQARIQQVNAAVRAAQARIQKATAMLAGAQAKAAQMQANIQASQSKVAQAQANAEALASAAEAAQHEIPHTEAGVQQAEAQLTTARVVAGYTEIRAEVDGVVTQRLVSPGQLVQPGQALLTISQISPIRLQANVAESDLPNIRVGNRVRAWTMRDPKHPVEARVTSLFPAADPTARTSIVEAIVPNTDRRLLPGDYITMDITTGENRSALVVPASALVWQPKATSDVLAAAQTPAVWVIEAGQPEKVIYTCTMHPQVKQDHPGKCPICGWELTPQATGGKWRAHLSSVTVGLESDKYVGIRSGLKAGDPVIYAGYENLKEGDPVVPTEWGPSGPLTLPPATGEVAAGTLYTCPMHPQVVQDHPGKCPICGMTLVPKSPAAGTPPNRPMGNMPGMGGMR